MDAATSLDSGRALDDAQVARQAERIAELESRTSAFAKHSPPAI